MHKSVDSNIVLLYHSTQIDTPSSDGYAFHKSGFCYRKKPRGISSVGREVEWYSKAYPCRSSISSHALSRFPISRV